MVDNRASWNEYFMLIAKVVSSRSTCLSRSVGAVIVKNNNILSTGYNGASTGSEHCIDTDVCYRRNLNIDDKNKHSFCVASHAEVNAIAQAANIRTCRSGPGLMTPNSALIFFSS